MKEVLLVYKIHRYNDRLWRCGQEFVGVVHSWLRTGVEVLSEKTIAHHRKVFRKFASAFRKDGEILERWQSGNAAAC